MRKGKTQMPLDGMDSPGSQFTPTTPAPAGGPPGPDPMQGSHMTPEQLTAMFSQMHSHLHSLQAHSTLGAMMQHKKGGK